MGSETSDIDGGWDELLGDLPAAPIAPVVPKAPAVAPALPSVGLEEETVPEADGGDSAEHDAREPEPEPEPEPAFGVGEIGPPPEPMFSRGDLPAMEPPLFGDDDESSYDTSAEIAKLIQRHEPTAADPAANETPSSDDEEASDDSLESLSARSSKPSAKKPVDTEALIFETEPGGLVPARQGSDQEEQDEERGEEGEQRASRSSPVASRAAAAPRPSSWNTPIVWMGSAAVVAAIGILALTSWRESDGTRPTEAGPTKVAAAGVDRGSSDAGAARPESTEDRRPPEAAAGPEPAKAGAAAVDGEAATTGGTGSGVKADPPVEAAAEGQAEPAAEAEGEAAADSGAEAPPIPSTAAAEAAYAEAEKAYEASGDNADLERMALAACQMDAGVEARAAYRKLRGGQSRGKVLRACRERDVDLAYEGDGPAPAELLRSARRSLRAGKPDKAIAEAKESNRAERSKEALVIMGEAACDLKDAKQARYYARMLSPNDRAPIETRCDETGVSISPPE